MTEEQHFRLQAFRTICREIHSKKHQQQKVAAMLGEHRRRREAFVLQRMSEASESPNPLALSAMTFENDDLEIKLVDHLAGIQSDLPELEALYANILDEIQNGGDKIAALVMNFDIQLPICLSGSGVLNYRESEGAPVKRALCILAILPEAGRSKLLLVVAKEHEAAIALHTGDHGSFAVIEMLESWVIHGTDHWFISPSAWERIPEVRRRAIRARMIEPFSLAERAPFSVLDEARQHIIAFAEAKLAAGEIAVDDLSVVKRTLAEQNAKLDWVGETFG